ncbi:hypothetical protein AURDEDRAFT_155230 [Auricularia subglabra TFB-10046 SS5]|nr:hypothetical protein AURDEDRAFT_155230 [Auricularia subglabra TFB-10046 SS5]
MRTPLLPRDPNANDADWAVPPAKTLDTPPQRKTTSTPRKYTATPSLLEGTRPADEARRTEPHRDDDAYVTDWLEREVRAIEIDRRIRVTPVPQSVLDWLERQVLASEIESRVRQGDIPRDVTDWLEEEVRATEMERRPRAYVYVRIQVKAKIRTEVIEDSWDCEDAEMPPGDFSTMRDEEIEAMGVA